MIEKLHRIATAIQILRLPLIGLGLFSLSSSVLIVLVSTTPAGDRWLMPSLVVLLWAISTYAFIATFRTIPAKANNHLRFFSKLKQHMLRGWYWCISLLFLATTGVVILITMRMVSIWLREYGS
jgi:hypothetical protein